MLNRLIAAGVLLAALAGFGWWVKNLHADNVRLAQANAELATDLEAAMELREVELKTAATHVKTINRLRAAQRKSNANLANAVAAEPTWANAAVPDGIAAALGVRVRNEPSKDTRPGDPASAVP